MGIFQQRWAAGWGSIDQIRIPAYATDAFFGGSPARRARRGSWTSTAGLRWARRCRAGGSSLGIPDRLRDAGEEARKIAASAGIDLTRSGDPYAGRAGAKPSGDDDGGSAPSTDDCGGGLISGQPINGVWPPEDASVTDPSGTEGMVTPRTAAWVSQARVALGTLSLGCWDAHLGTPPVIIPRAAPATCSSAEIHADRRRSKPDGDRIANWTHPDGRPRPACTT